MSILKKILSISLSTQMLLALAFGIAVGLFFGPMVAWMGDIGSAVIMLMQMTIYPFIVVSLIHGIGRLDIDSAKKWFSRAGLIMVGIWILGLVVIAITPIAFPVLESASFFSSSEVITPEEINYLKIYIPANPFESMASGAVPAVVLFSLALGIALISVKNKEAVLTIAGTTAEALSKITQSVVKILPIGVFAMSASAAGTIGVAEFASLQVFLITYFVLCMLLALLILPLLLSSLTPFSYGEVLKISWAAMVTAFSTGNIFICLPVIMEESKALLKKHDLGSDKTDDLIDVLLPVAFTFPNLGKLTIILFVFFSGWFIGKPVDIASYPMVSFSGLMSLFGSVYVAMPFMLDSVQLPTDLNHLFVVSSFITGKFNSMVAVMNLIVVVLLSTFFIMLGFKKFKAGMVKFFIIIIPVTLAMLLGTKVLMGFLVDGSASSNSLIAGMRVTTEVDSKAYKDLPSAQELNGRVVTVDVIKQRGILRVGFQRNNVPFSYFNQDNELVGFDVSVAYKLAEDLGVKVAFVPYEYEQLPLLLRQGYFDFAMSGIEVDAELMQEISFTTPVLKLNFALVALDHDVKSLGSIEEFKRSRMKIAVVQHGAIIENVKEKYPKIEFIQLNGYLDFFNQTPGGYDALLTSAEAGYAWSLFYPEYGVAVLKSDQDKKTIQFPVAYAVAKRNQELLTFIDNWLELHKVYGTMDREHEYWIQGKGAQSTEPRWSVIRNVLGWVADE